MRDTDSEIYKTLPKIIEEDVIEHDEAPEEVKNSEISHDIHLNEEPLENIELIDTSS